MSVRLQKLLADAGVASRRASEAIITEGRVTVNGELVRLLGTKVDPDRDQVAVDGVRVRARKKIYAVLNKPRGFVCTRSDEQGRRTVMDLLPAEWAHVHPVGRLDRDTEGLLFLTNDGEFSLKITHPRHGLVKKYVATLPGRVDPGIFAIFQRGVLDQGERLRARGGRVIESSNTRSTVELELTEGRNREVRRLFASQGLEVQTLRRVQIGRIRLGELPAGKWRTLTAAEIKSLLGA